MNRVVTEAIVLHAFDYRETSRILRLATRDAGVRSVVARGARRPGNRFGPALDLFAQGTAEMVLHATNDLHTIVGFDVLRVRTALAERWERFTGANALGELVLRFATDEAHEELFDAFARGLDDLSTAKPSAATRLALAAAWRVVAALGFAPELEACASCGTSLPPGDAVRFSHRAGGALCVRCAARLGSTHTLPASARQELTQWIGGAPSGALDDQTQRAHLRLLRVFLQEHVGDHRPLRAFAVWEGRGL